MHINTKVTLPATCFYLAQIIVLQMSYNKLNKRHDLNKTISIFTLFSIAFAACSLTVVNNNYYEVGMNTQNTLSTKHQLLKISFTQLKYSENINRINRQLQMS